MGNKIRLFFCFVCFLSFISLPASAALFGAQHAILSNGLEIILIPSGLSKAVTQMVWYKVGSADDPEGKSGLAHYLEHLMFKGTKDVPAGTFSRIVAAHGGEDNAFTSYDMTVYHESFAASNLPLMMRLEADRMRHLQIPEETALTERAVVASERQERTDNNPHGLFQEKLRALLFGKHPYGRPVIGYKKEIEKLTPADARAFYKKYYAPNNAVVVISGAIDVGRTLALAEEIYGKLAPEENSQRKPSPALKAPLHAQLEMQDARIKQAYGMRLLTAASMNTSPQEAYALMIADDILSHGEIGLLYKNFVLQKKTATYISSSYNPDARGLSVFSLAFVASPDTPLPKLEEAISSYLEKIAKRGFTKKEIMAAKDRLIASAIFARDGVMMPAQIFGQASVLGQRLDDIENWGKKIRAVPARAVSQSLRDLLRSPQSVTGFLYPAGGDAP